VFPQAGVGNNNFEGTMHPRIDFSLEKLNGEVEFTLEVYSALASEGAEKHRPQFLLLQNTLQMLEQLESTSAFPCISFV
jgi:hypothetical protein